MGAKKLFDSIEEFGIWINVVGIKTFVYYENQRNRHDDLKFLKPFDGLTVDVDDLSVINADIAIKELTQRVKDLNMKVEVEVYSSNAFPDYSIRIRLDNKDGKYWEELHMSCADNSILSVIEHAKLLESVMDGSYYK